MGILDNLATEFPTTSWWDKLFVHAPFSLWHGWSVFLAVVNAFIAFTHVRKDDQGNVREPNVFVTVLIYLALAILTATAISYVEYKHKKGDVTSALVIAFGLWAIFDEQRIPIVHWGAFTAALISTIYPIKPFIYRILGYGTPETAPLLG
ncbi:hypothetical protein EC973_000232 [Apophysomyces ossiformis]|uniref:Uncharacterized protein n=1 Tax=Apophysomyces ossiformis TaxID=679940 RepID=A0A8H7ETM3_9FUNG|nr:hypothetical protein EC973_000232 [Apophysomyces ossiformis]